MGIAKQQAMENEDRYWSGVGVLVEVGALEECENHPGTYFDCDPERVVDAYKLANSRLTQNGATTAKRRKVTDAIKEAYENNSGNDGCECCRKAFGPD
jgi:hypothetical protein